MDRATPGASRWAAAAVAHVEARSVGGPLDGALRVTLNFHPDRAAGGLLTIEAMARDGVYRSQFETGTSNGGLTARPGGDRWRWEQHLFGGAYDDAPAAERPRYGALDHRRRPLGGAPRFGSAHLRLAAHVLERATFCHPDSSTSPSDVATARRFDLLRLLEAPAARDADPLDGYVEAHVHGVVEIARDAEAVVLDPCFRDSDVEAAAASLGIPVEWHEGRVLTTGQLLRNRAYRDPDAVEVGLALARDGVVDARLIGDAARSGRYHPQSVKQVWHHTARFGVRRDPAGAAP